MTLQQIASAVERSGACGERGVVSIYVFGSVVAGRVHRESDVDLGVLLNRQVHPTTRARFDVRLRLFAALATALGTDRLDLVMLNDAPPQFARRIVTDGVRVYCADPAGDHDFRRDVQLRAADVEPFLRRTAKSKLDAIART